MKYQENSKFEDADTKQRNWIKKFLIKNSVKVYSISKDNYLYCILKLLYEELKNKYKL